MRRAVERRMSLVVLVLVGLSVAGELVMLLSRAFEQRPRDLIAEGAVLIDPDPTGNVQVPHAHAFVQDGTLLVKGIVRCGSCTTQPQDDSLDVALFSPAGLLLDRASCRCGLADAGGVDRFFSVYLRTVPPPASRIQFRCGASEQVGAHGPLVK